MTPDTRAFFLAQMEAEGIDPSGVEAQSFLARQEAPRLRLVVNGEYRPRIVLPTITGARLAAARATNSIGVSSSHADVTEAGQSSSGPASSPYSRVLRLAAMAGLVVALLAAAFTPAVHALNRQAQAYEWSRV